MGNEKDSVSLNSTQKEDFSSKTFASEIDRKIKTTGTIQNERSPKAKIAKKDLRKTAEGNTKAENELVEAECEQVIVSFEEEGKKAGSRKVTKALANVVEKDKGVVTADLSIEIRQENKVIDENKADLYNKSEKANSSNKSHSTVNKQNCFDKPRTTEDCNKSNRKAETGKKYTAPSLQCHVCSSMYKRLQELN